MKAVSIAISLLAGLLVGTGHGQQVRVSMQYFELPHTVMIDLLAGEEIDGSKLHDKAFALAKDGKAKILETSIVVCPGGGNATTESIREEIYPTETQPPELPSTFSGSASRLLYEEDFSLRKRSFTAFDTRNTGMMLEVGAVTSADGRSIELRLIPEIVSRNRLETMAEYRDKRGDTSVRMPIYEAWRTNTTLTVQSGKFALVSVIHPLRQQAAPFVDSRILLFVRADVLEAP